VKASTTEWLQAWGTIAGAAFAAAAAIAAFLVLLHEIRIRRRDEDDLRASTARSVIVTTGDEKGIEPKEDADGSITSMELCINNFSRFPVVDVFVMVERLSGRREFAWGTDLLKPGETQVKKCVFHPALAWPPMIPPPNLFRTRMVFTDDNGLRWQRIDHQPPSRIFASEQLPEWDFWFRKLHGSKNHELRPGPGDRRLCVKESRRFAVLPIGADLAGEARCQGSARSEAEGGEGRRP
jgi:hypothetical protein